MIPAFRPRQAERETCASKHTVLSLNYCTWTPTAQSLNALNTDKTTVSNFGRVKDRHSIQTKPVQLGLYRYLATGWTTGVRHKFPTVSEAHPDSCPVGTGFKLAGGLKLSTYLLVLPRSRMREVVPPLPRMSASWRSDTDWGKF